MTGSLRHSTRYFYEITIVGGTYIIGNAALPQFGRHHDNQLLIMSKPTDALSKDITNDLERFRKVSPENFEGPSAPFFIKRCQTAVEIIAGCLPDSARAVGLSKHVSSITSGSCAEETSSGIGICMSSTPAW